MFTRINTWLLSVNLLLVYFPVLFLDFTLLRLVLLDFCGNLVIFWHLHSERLARFDVSLKHTPSYLLENHYNVKCLTFPIS